MKKAVLLINLGSPDKPTIPSGNPGPTAILSI